MSPILLGIISLIILLLIMFMHVPIGVSMAILGIIGFSYLVSLEAALHMASSSFNSLFFNYNWAVIPLFMFMGLILFNAGVGEKIYRTTYYWFGHWPGGLLIANIAGSSLFGSVCASATATAATMGAVSLPEMKKYGYDLGFGAGCIASAGTLGVMFPPSVTFIVYGILAEESIAKLFIAGVLPGILSGFFLYVVVYIAARRNPSIAPAATKSSWGVRFSSSKAIIDPLILFILIFGGIFGGFFTPTEAAGVGAFGALAICMIRRYISWQKFKASVMGTLVTSAFVYTLIVGALIFGYFLARTNLSFAIAKLVGGFDIHPVGILVAIMLVYLIGGFVIEALPLLMLTIPIFLPIIKELGYDPIWFGVIIVIVSQIALITPPVGVVTLVVGGMAKDDISMMAVFRGVMPYILALLFSLLLIILFPQLSLFLPSFMKF